MRIIKTSAMISKMSNDDIKREILSSPPVEKTLSLLNEAYKRKYIEAFYEASSNPRSVNYLPIQKLMINMVEVNPQSPASVAIVDNMLELIEKGKYLPSTITKINSVSLSNPAITSTVLLHYNSPNELVDSIIGSLHLNVVKNTDKVMPFLQAIIEDLKSGELWNNERSGLIMASRIVQYPQDPFLNEISKYNLCPPFAGSLINASRLYRVQNPTLRNNIESNTNSGVEIARLVYSDIWENVQPNTIIPGLIVSLEKSKYQPYCKWIWNLLKDKIKTKPEWELASFTSRYGGDNIIDAILKMLPSIFPDLIDIIKSSQNIEPIKRSPVYEEIINMGLSNPSYQEKTLELPETYFQMIRMTKENRKIVENRFHPKIEGWEDIEELMAGNNWYKKYSSVPNS